MRCLFCGALLVFALPSCKVYPPVYKRVENFRLEHIDGNGFKVYGDLVLFNPNKMHVKLKDVLMNIELNGKHVATAGQKEPVPIKAQSEFAVPLNLVIRPEMSFKEGIQNIFHVIQTKEMDVTINGVIVIKAMGVKLSIPIQQTEKVDISKLR
jgi:LEA14-like dessication related protein